MPSPLAGETPATGSFVVLMVRNEMANMKVRLGFVATHRFGFTPWCRRMRDESLAALAGAPGVEVVAATPAPDDKALDAANGMVPFGSVQTLDQADALAKYFARQDLDALVVCPLDFGDERAAAKAAERLRLPVFLYATKEPAADEGPSLSRVSDSYCGNLALAAALHRRKVRFHFGGVFFPAEPELAAALADFVSAVSVGKGLLAARLGQVGIRPPAFESVAYDEIAMARRFGQNVICTALSDILDAANAIPADSPALAETLAQVRAAVAQVSVADDYLVKAARIEVALADFCQQQGLSGLGVQCWPQTSGINLCAILGRLTERGWMAACETDILGVLSMIVSHRSVQGRTPPHLIDWTIQHRKEPNRVLAWHCGNAPACLAADVARTALRSREDMKGALPARMGDVHAGLYQFQIRPGPVTLCRLAEYDGAWKMLIVRGRICPSSETLAGTWSWVEVADHARLYRTLVEEGFIHHASMIHGDQAAALKLACKLLDIQPVVVE